MDSGVPIYILLVIGILLDGHSTFIGLKRNYKERNPFLLGLAPRSVIKTTTLMWIVLSILFVGHITLKTAGVDWYDYRHYEMIFLALALAKIIVAVENYALAFLGNNLGSILRRKPKALLPEPLVDVVITLMIIAFPAILLAKMLYGAGHSLGWW